MKYSSGYFFILILFTSTFISSCAPGPEEEPLSLDQVADDYVKLGLKIGEYDSDFIDAYFGPEEWRPRQLPDTSRVFPYEELKWETTELLSALEEAGAEELDSLEMMRYKYLHGQLIAVKTRLDMISGDLLPFDVETRALYDAAAPHFSQNHFDELLNELNGLLPGSGSLADRYLEFSKAFIIPDNKLDTVFKTAIAEARRRTLEHIKLPENENFKVEYVTDKSWSGYNWYQGNSQSLIQLNTDFPIYIERAIDLACHEGYPGHHVYNVSLENNLLKKHGWNEFSIYLLFSPQSLIAEGSANYGIEVAFPGDERREFERDVLFPLAGINPSLVDRYYDIQDVRSKLYYADTEAARLYLNRQIKREEAAEWLVTYNLIPWEKALQRTRFFDKYRSYVINYTYGKDLVKNYTERQGGLDSEKRWEIFSRILSTPLSASFIE